MKAIMILVVLVLLVVLTSGLPVHYCKVETKNCYTGKCDTIFIRVRGSLCLARTEGEDTAFDKLADGSNRVFKDSVCDYRVLYYSKEKF